MASSAFSRPKYNGRQANLGNTVLVNIGQLRTSSDLWCLGYLQNIESEQALIDLDCAQFPPFWISTQYVWYHHLTDFGSFYQYALRPPPMNVQVALRNELDGPFVFRTAQLLNRPTYGNLYVCCVAINATEAGQEDGQDIQVVHHWQVVQALPIDEPPLLGRLRQTGSLDEIPILKQTVHSEKIGIIQTFPERRIKSLVFMAVKRAGFARNGIDLHRPRVYVEIGKESIMVLLFDLHLLGLANGAVGPREWTALSKQKFASEVEEWVGRYTLETAPDVSMWHPSMIVRGGTNAFCQHVLEKETESLVGILPWELLSEVLLSLDLHSQLSAKRVSSVWYSLLRTGSVCTVIDFTSFSKRTHFIGASEGYYFGTLLDRAVSQKTRALGLYNMDPVTLHGYDDAGRILEAIRNLLVLKQVGLLAIMLKNCCFIYELTLTWEEGDFKTHVLFHISKLQPVCQRLLFLNITTIDYHGCDCGVILGRVISPEYVTVTFPSLEFHRSAGEGENIMRYVKALEPQLPSVDAVKARFKERHQLFVETVPYPDGWQRFRQFLRRHTFSELSMLDSFWNELDLRNFDQLPLNKMVLLPLDACIDIIFENANV